MTQINLAPVFKVVNDLANNPATAVCRNGRVVMNGAMRAIGAGERARYGAFERLGALLAKWRDDADSFSFAVVAQIRVRSNICSADCADRWIKKRYERT